MFCALVHTQQECKAETTSFHYWFAVVDAESTPKLRDQVEQIRFQGRLLYQMIFSPVWKGV